MENYHRWAVDVATNLRETMRFYGEREGYEIKDHEG
jgi:hypothetical protein